jgi:hypothetical protein
MIEPAVRYAVHDLARRIGDGRPEFQAILRPTATGTAVPQPCSAGVGTRGGVSRGKGSGSRLRLRLWECACSPPPIERQLIAHAQGRVLDLGAGAGPHSRHLMGSR